MLKPRLIGVVVVRGGLTVQSIGFRRYLPIGRPTIAVDYLDRWGIDEIVLLDIDATTAGRAPDLHMVEACAARCQVPLAVGGGIDEVTTVERVIRAGADKVIINSAAWADPTVLERCAERFGSQCVVASIDIKGGIAMSHSASRPLAMPPTELAALAARHGAGEVLVTSVDRDGSKRGYDLALLKAMLAAVTIPVIVCGGVGHVDHFGEALDAGVSAVAAANFFHWSEHSVIVAKSYLQQHGATIRSDSYASYDGREFDVDGRIAKIDDARLEKLRFEYIPEERI